MSGLLNDNIARLESLNEREKFILDYIILNKDFKLIEVAKIMHLGESTTRSILTSVFTKLRVPEGERDKRGYIVREYAEAYKARYLKPNSIMVKASDVLWKPPSNVPPDSRIIYIPVPVEKGQNMNDDPWMNVTPPPARQNPTPTIVWVLAGFSVIAVLAIIILVVLIQVLNRPTQTTQTNNNPTTVIQNTDVPIPTQIPPTSVSVPTQVPPTNIPTSIPQTPTVLLSPTPKAFYDQGEGAYLRESVVISLDPDFRGDGFVGCPIPNPAPKPGFVAALWIQNIGGNNFTARFDRMSFSAVDDTGKAYPIKVSGIYFCQNTPGIVSEDFSPNAKNQLVLGFSGQIPLAAKYIYITINDISGSGKIVFRKIL